MSVRRDDLDKFFEYSVHVPTRTIYMGTIANPNGTEDGTDFSMAEYFIKGIHLLSSVEGDIKIIMNNPGGDECHGMAIYDAIAQCKNHVTIIATGYAMSMGSIILQAADERVLTSHASLMIHYGVISVEDHPHNVNRWVAESKRFDIFMEDLYLAKIREKHPKYKRSQLKALMQFDKFFTPEEAVKLGLADKIG